MDRVASLLVTASSLQRKLFASLPWGHRLAMLFLALDTAGLKGWGRNIGKIMLQAGVTDMPDPGPRWKPERPSDRDLPPDYLYDFAKAAYAFALKGTQNPADADDTLQDVMLALLAKKNEVEARPFSSAKSWIMTALNYSVSGRRKKKDNQKGVRIDHGGEGGETTLDIVEDRFRMNPHWLENPREFEKIEDVFPEDVWDREVIPAMKRIHEDLPIFFKYLEEGQTAKAIIENGLLPHFDAAKFKTPLQTWNAKVQKAKDVLRDIARKHDDAN